MKANHKKTLVSFFCVLVVLASAITPVSASFGTSLDNSEIIIDDTCVPGEVIVTFKDDISTNRQYSILENVTNTVRIGASAIDSVGNNSEAIKFNSLIQSHTIIVPVDKVESTIKLLRTFDEVVSAKPNQYVYMCDDADRDIYSAFAGVQSERSYDSSYDPTAQWHLDRMNVKSAWEMGFVGSSSIVVAVLDTGYGYHADLDPHIDHDRAYNVVDNSHNVTDTVGHGTFIAGVIGACLNGTGTNGICQNVTIVPIKIAVYENGNSDEAHIIAGINKAKEIGADVINLSYEVPNTANVRSSIRSFGKLVVIAAGNRASLMSPSVEIPNLVNDEPLWFTVGASTQSNTKWCNSNYSPIYIDIFAPGDNIYSTGYAERPNPQGATSYAAPMLTASVALIMSHATHLSPAQIKSYLMENVTTISGFDQYCVAGGIINLSKTVLAIYNEDRGAYSRGDVDGNGKVDSVDYLYAKRIALGTYTPTEQQIDILDIDRDGSVTANDYMVIKRYYLNTYYFPPR